MSSEITNFENRKHAANLLLEDINKKIDEVNEEIKKLKYSFHKQIILNDFLRKGQVDLKILESFGFNEEAYKNNDFLKQIEHRKGELSDFEFMKRIINEKYIEL